MTFLLTNSQKIEILDNNCIAFTFAKNIIFVGFLNVTAMSDENFSKLVLNCDFNN